MEYVQRWISRAGLASGRVFRAVNKAGQIASLSMTPQAVCKVAPTYRYQAGLNARNGNYVPPH